MYDNFCFSFITDKIILIMGTFPDNLVLTDKTILIMVNVLLVFVKSIEMDCTCQFKHNMSLHVLLLVDFLRGIVGCSL